MADNIRVVCRVRPLNAKEKANGSTEIVSFPSQNALAVNVRKTCLSCQLDSFWPFLSAQNKVFQYDQVFRPDSTQVAVYAGAAQPLVKGKTILCSPGSL